eukprot:g12126.t1
MCEHDGEPFHESLSVAFKSALTKFDSLKLGMSWMYLIVRSLQPASAVVLQTCPPPPSPRSAYFAGGVSVQEVIAMLLDEMRQDQDFAHLLGNDLRHKEFVKFVSQSIGKIYGKFRLSMCAALRRLLQDVARCHVVEEVLQQATHAEVVAQGAKDLMEGRNEGVVLAFRRVQGQASLRKWKNSSEGQGASKKHAQRLQQLNVISLAKDARRPRCAYFDLLRRPAEEETENGKLNHDKPPFGRGMKNLNGPVPPCDVKESIRQMRAACADLQEMFAGAETFRSFYRGMVDSIIAHLLMKRRPQLSDTNPFEQYVLVLDVLGATRRNFSMTAIQVMIHESNNYYPDRVAQIFVLGVNLAEYGGSAPRLPSPAQAKTLSDMAGPIPADIWEKLGAVRMLEEKTAMASKICVAWDMPPYGFRQMRLSCQFCMVFGVVIVAHCPLCK